MPSSSQRRYQLPGLAGGLKSDRHPTRLRDNQTPRAINVEYSDDSARSSRGSLKAGNQIAPRPGVLCQPDPAYSPLYIEASKSVPLRGYIYHRFDETTDIGGDFADTGTFGAPNYLTRRGKNFERQISFTIPSDFQMGDRPSRGEGAPAAGAGNSAIENGCGYDEGLDDCTLIDQKGGNRTVPLSWAIGIVNAGNHHYNVGLGSALPRKSNYFLVFMWLDAPEWAPQAPMRYSLTNPSSPNAYATEALRAFILDGRSDTVAYALEPGRSYSVSISVTLDTASVSGSSWNNNGRVDVRLQEHGGRLYTGSFVDSGGGGTTTNLSIYKGPSDSLRYLAKYGIRYSAKDAEYVGLGYRTAPWNAQGFIPYGMDSAAMEHKGFRMADCSLNSTADLYGGGAYTLACSHAVGTDTFVTINANRALTVGNANFSQSPLGRRAVTWGGYGGAGSGAPATDFNPDALRGYRLVFPRSSVTNFQGGCFNIQNYVEQSGSEFRLFLQDVGSTATTWTSQPFLIRAFRWNQQAIIVQERRHWTGSRDYTDPRVAFSLRSSIELYDETEPDIFKLKGYWPYDDAGGRVLRELVRGKHAFFSPFAVPLSEEGSEGKNSIFLSGEGEALVYDLSENPVFRREMRHMLQSNSRGFAIELSCIIPEAFYGIATIDASGPRPLEYEAAYCPDLVSLSVKEADDAGTASPALPLLVMGHHSWWTSSGNATSPERRPQGFHVEVFKGLESETLTMTPAIRGHTRSTVGAGNWDDTVPWVGKRVTIQVGMQPSPDNRNGVAGKSNEFRVYIAVAPMGLFKFTPGDDAQAELAHFADILIQKKELVRTVLTIGGGWNPIGPRGYTEYSAPLIVDSVRFYGATAAGELPTASGLVTADKRGKILGTNSLPQRALTQSEILQPLGVGLRTVSVTEQSTVVGVPGNTAFFTQPPEATKDSIREKFLVLLTNQHEIPTEVDVPEFIQDFNWIQSVASDGLSLTLATAYDGPDSKSLGAACTNLIGYVNFDRASDDIARQPLTIGSGRPYKPGVTTSADLVLSDELFANLAPVDGAWRMRIASPFVDGGLATIIPRWVRGIVAPRRNEITGIHALDADIYATARGAAFLVDDRWREDGPTRELRSSLAFSGRKLDEFEARAPLVGDAVRFANYTNAWPYFTATTNKTWVYDAWVWVDEYVPIETILWLGCEHAHMLRGAGATDDQRGLGLWLRLNDGRPEVVRQTSDPVSPGGGQALDGRYSVGSADRVPFRQWAHVRFLFEHYTSGSALIRIPAIFINGRRTSVIVSAQSTTAVGSGGWMAENTGGGIIGSAGDTRNALYLGVARDVVRVGAKTQFTSLSQLGGREYPGSRIGGRLHPLLGRLAGVVVWRADVSDPLVSGFPDFDPFTLNYTGRDVRFRADLQEGVGYKVGDRATSFEVGFTPTVGIVESHPFVDLYNELGRSLERPSFAVAGQKVYIANGGRVGYVAASGGGAAGILPPTIAPRATIERKPLWEENNAEPGSTSAEQDPIRGIDGLGAPIYHYSTFGNNYLTQAFDGLMRWQRNRVADTLDVFSFKCYWHPRDVAGTLPIYSARGSKEAGGIFVECVDGKARVGWYDPIQKKQVYIETSSAVFLPGHWHYIYVRKRYPDRTWGQNWHNSFWANGKRRRVQLTSVTGTWNVGDIIRNGAATKRALITESEIVSFFGFAPKRAFRYVLFDGDSDFANTEAVNNGSGATATISGTPVQITGDSIVVRPFLKSALAVNDSPLLFAHIGSVRNAISLSSERARIDNTTAVGQITPKGALFTGASGGVITSGTMLSKPTALRLFTADMVGMQFQFKGATAVAPEKVYRIASVASSSSLTVVDEYGNNPNLAAFVNAEGGVFAGVELVKSEDFSLSRDADDSANGIEFLGSSLAAEPDNKFSKMSAKAASFGWHVASCSHENYTGFNAFEAATPTDLSEMGTDFFPFPIYDSSTDRPGELRFDPTVTFSCVDGQRYTIADDPASTLPNEGLEVATDPLSSGTVAQSLFWQSLVATDQTPGRREIRVAFFDVGQDTISNPSPKLVIEVPEEDKSNPSGLTRLILTDLPISHQRGRIERWVYVTLANQPIPFRQAIVPDNVSSSVSVLLDDRAASVQVPLFFDNAPPPECSAIGISQGVMFFGDVRTGGARAKDGLRFSKPIFFLSVPFQNFTTLLGGQTERIVGMADVAGRLIVWKKDSMFMVTVREGGASIEAISKNVGLAGPQAFHVVDADLYWLSSDRGLYYLGSGGYPFWLGENVSDAFLGRGEEINVDPREIARASLVCNRAQDQVIFAFQETSERDMRRRYSVEYDSALSGGEGSDLNNFRYAAYSDPNVTALGYADRPFGGTQRVLAGTAEGFVAYLDRTDTQLQLASSEVSGTIPLWNPPTVTLGVGSTTSALILSSSSSDLTSLEGIRGARLSWVVAGVEYGATALFSNGDAIYLDRFVSVAPPTGTLVTIGAIPWVWESKWFDLGNLEQRKQIHYLDLTLVPQASGSAFIEFFKDFETAPTTLSTASGLVTAEPLDLSKPTRRVPLGEIRCQYIRFRVRSDPATFGTKVEITDAVIRPQDLDLH